MARAVVRVNGIVQSVGFRPFVYRTATNLGLAGTVRNVGDAGVRIELEGSRAAIDAFLAAVKADTPPLAVVETVDIDREPTDRPAFASFEIARSTTGSGAGGTIPPDTGMCEACLGDMHDPGSRYQGYWATSCVDCGPRFTVIEALPYDRPTTAMAAFPLCDACHEEYTAPSDRRYHAQTTACPGCGPRLRYFAAEAVGTGMGSVPGRDAFPAGEDAGVAGAAAVGAAADTLAAGGIVVLKGIGGAHLACDATNDSAVDLLRERTGRPQKPFAVMTRDADAAASFARVTCDERAALTGQRRPILLLEARTDSPVSPGVAPGLHTVGVMLPYSGVHHLLFAQVDGPVVMTSANLPGRPMLIRNRVIAADLAGVADGFLLHDRRIVARCDDSVARFVGGGCRFVRRSRGWVPTQVPVMGVDGGRVLGLGPELDVAAGILAGGDCYLTQYIGDTDDVDTVEYLTDAIDHLRAITGAGPPRIVAHDLHPGFRTTEYARELERDGMVGERVGVQHHHAHAASVLAEHGREAAIVITADGVGYGSDGTVWGGEVLDASLLGAERVGGLSPVDMPGADQATRHPGRMVAGILYRHDPAGIEDQLRRCGIGFPGGAEERRVVCEQLAAGVNTPVTTSAGRFLDAVSALVGACQVRTYEGEPAMKLEALASRTSPVDLGVPFAQIEGRRVVDTPVLLVRLVGLLEDGTRREVVASTAQDALARGLGELGVAAAVDRGRDAVGFSGGVAYNEQITTRIRKVVEGAGLVFLGNEQVPAGDGGVAYGQVAVATARASDG